MGYNGGTDEGEGARQQGRGTVGGGSSTYKNRPSHHKYKSPKEFVNPIRGE